MNKKQRISKDELYTLIAKAMAGRGTCGRLQVGAILTLNGRVVATGYNGPLKSEKHCEAFGCNLNEPCGRAIHAEANAIAHAARFGIALAGTTLYVTHSPCKDCARLLIQAGIKEVIYAEEFRSEEGLAILRKQGIEVTHYQHDN